MHKVTPVPSILDVDGEVVRIYDAGFGHSEEIGSIKIEGAQLIGYYGPYYWYDEEHKDRDLITEGSTMQTNNN